MGNPVTKTNPRGAGISKGSKPRKRYDVLTARAAINQIGRAGDPFIYLAECVAARDATSLPAARHLSTFIEPQISRTELSGPDSNALTINFLFDAKPGELAISAKVALPVDKRNLIDVTPLSKDGILNREALSKESTHNE